MIRHGFYSKKAHEKFGAIVYKSSKGNEIVVTQVGDNPSLRTYKWDDTVYVGEVISYVKDLPPSDKRYLFKNTKENFK